MHLNRLSGRINIKFPMTIKYNHKRAALPTNQNQIGHRDTLAVHTGAATHPVLESMNSSTG